MVSCLLFLVSLLMLLNKVRTGVAFFGGPGRN